MQSNTWDNNAFMGSLQRNINIKHPTHIRVCFGSDQTIFIATYCPRTISIRRKIIISSYPLTPIPIYNHISILMYSLPQFTYISSFLHIQNNGEINFINKMWMPPKLHRSSKPQIFCALPPSGSYHGLSAAVLLYMLADQLNMAADPEVLWCAAINFCSISLFVI